MHYGALRPGQADVLQTRLRSFHTRVEWLPVEPVPRHTGRWIVDERGTVP
jgi:hypothetical protein